MTASWFRISADVLAPCLRISANASAAAGRFASFGASNATPAFLVSRRGGRVLRETFRLALAPSRRRRRDRRARRSAFSRAVRSAASSAAEGQAFEALAVLADLARGLRLDLGARRAQTRAARPPTSGVFHRLASRGAALVRRVGGGGGGVLRSPRALLRGRGRLGRERRDAALRLRARVRATSSRKLARAPPRLCGRICAAAMARA